LDLDLGAHTAKTIIGYNKNVDQVEFANKGSMDKKVEFGKKDIVKGYHPHIVKIIYVIRLAQETPFFTRLLYKKSC